MIKPKGVKSTIILSIIDDVLLHEMVKWDVEIPMITFTIETLSILQIRDLSSK